MSDYGAADAARLRAERDGAVEAGDQARVDLLGREIVQRLEQGEAQREADLKLRANERIRYSANLVNGIATAVVSLGVAAPVLGMFVPGSPYETHPLLLAGLGVVICLFALSLLQLARMDSTRVDRARKAALVSLATVRIELGVGSAHTAPTRRGVKGRYVPGAR